MRETWLPTTTVLRREYSSLLQETRRRKGIAVETETMFAADYVKSTTALISRNSVDISNLISVKEVITQEEYCSGIQVIHSSLRTTIRVLLVIVLTKQRRDLWQRELVSFTESILGSSWRYYWILYLPLSSRFRYRVCVITENNHPISSVGSISFDRLLSAFKGRGTRYRRNHVATVCLFIYCGKCGKGRNRSEFVETKRRHTIRWQLWHAARQVARQVKLPK